jgi:dihydrolipoamide dehydrogenase
MESFDVIVIGSGPGGYIAAVRAAKRGFKVACVEKNKKPGGTCLNVGCIPSKALLQSSENVAFLKHQAKEHGILTEDASFDFSVMQKRKDSIVEGLVNSVASLLSQNKVTWIEGAATFVSPNEIVVNNTKYQAKTFILATGSESISLPDFPFDEKTVVSSTGALALQQVPKKMAVIGAGVIGLELASVYNRLGAKVEIFEMLDRICPAMDGQVSRELLRILKKQGLEFYLKKKVDRKEIDADVILVAVGRRPYTDGLGLQAIGVKTTPKGFVEVNNNYQTSLPHIYAIGDIVSGPMLAHRASDEGVAVVDFLAGVSLHVNMLSIPNIIYTMPEVAAVGMTEEEAKEAGLSLHVGVCQMRGNPRARCSGEIDGFVKVIADQKSGKLVGMHIICEHASEMIGEGVVAIDCGMTLHELAQSSHGHPTLSEAIKEAAMLALGVVN